jgi:hypothetical protein
MVNAQQAKDVHHIKTSKEIYIKQMPQFDLTQCAELTTLHQTMFISR